MVFSSLLFLFVYLPIVLLSYYICPRKWRNLLLFAVNLIFYGWGEPIYVSLMIISTIVDYTCGYFIDKNRDSNPKVAKRFLIASMVINLSMLGFFKYSGMVLKTLNLLPFINIPIPNLPALPIGISFYTFQTMSYSIDVYRREAPVQKNVITFGTYVSLFPQLIAGPIVRYKDVAYQLDHRRETLDDFTKGVCIFCVGLAKKVLIANQMGAMWEAMRATGQDNGWLGAWLGIIAYSFQIYFDFSGYSDMACGLGNMLGFEFLKNFNYPYISKSITEFWRRWHISLGTWFREYVYIPLGGNRKGIARQMINLLIVWFLTGLWHGASYNFILWGLYFGLLLVLEKFILKKWLDKAPAAVQHIYALFFIIIGWVIFFFSDDMGGMTALWAQLRSMFSFGGIVIGNNALTLVMSYLPVLLIACVASTPLGVKLYEKVKESAAAPALQTVYCGIVLLLSTAFLVAGSYNPFIYFRF
ncbi:MBOAT family O-acyltransferase [uncultured Ruminococcus sp.]|uniref:MBOAT family O-acyltransferase n=1 Tax=uncultured Ruminococcus sp. TaxID=165186 RepID=UPI00292F92D2|nr:MBOAT family O-acyltransferase [uncultured Ruminococcus sp.]